MTLSIDTLTAYLAVNEEGEGIMGFKSEGGWMPLVCADEARAESMRPIAEMLASAAGVRCVVARFSVREDLEIIEPGVLDPDGPTVILTDVP